MRHSAKRLGRGIGSGLGKTGGRGHKGQKSHYRRRCSSWFRGWSNAFYIVVAKFGFYFIKIIPCG
ncbi:uL15 family ribosomal protein [Mannheimia haemolytica]|nr:uL15 family ribosomal protein [Mannheimia haemolytica]